MSLVVFINDSPLLLEEVERDVAGAIAKAEGRSN